MDENRITAYLNGALARNEELDFEALMQEDPILKEKVQRQEQILKALEYESYSHFLEKVKTFETTLPEINKRAPPPVLVPLVRRLSPVLIAAASIILLIGIGFYYILPKIKTINASEKVLNYYSKPAFVGLAAMDDDVANFNNGIVQFDSSHFETAINFLQNIKSESKLFLRTQYILAHCYFNLKKYDNALKHLKLLEGNEEKLSLLFGEDFRRIDKQEIDWFKTLCLFGNQQKIESLLLLNKISSDPKNRYYEKAVTLKKEID